MNEAKESAKHFLEQVNGGGFSRYPVLSARIYKIMAMLAPFGSLAIRTNPAAANFVKYGE